MIFKLGLLLVPFENLKIAPSSGWAAIAPIVFFFYVIINGKYLIKVINKSLILSLLGLIVYNLFLFLIYGFDIKNILDNIVTITLGITFYFSLKIRYLQKKGNLINDINVLFFSYFISLIIGVIQYFSYKLNLYFIINLFSIISKRFYYPRIQMTFTEPSFIPVHIFGIMLVFILFCKKNNIQLPKRNYWIFYMYITLANIMVKSTRLALDTIIVFMIVIVFNSKNKIKIIFNILSIFLIGYVTLQMNKEILKEYDTRLYNIIEKGVYIDDSLASRYFRINASLKSYRINPEKIIIGYGMGNIFIPFNEGYEMAKKEYKNNYFHEVKMLKDTTTSTLFSMPIKIISEYGIFIFLFICIVLYSKKYMDIYFLISYMYIQFDSYALYTVWLYIFLKNYLQKKRRRIE